jgi:hypothetical protein
VNHLPTSAIRCLGTAWSARRAVFLLWLGLAVAFSARGQNPTAKVSGTVTDKSGAAIPGALVTLVNRETDAKIEGRTDESGIYLASFISPGPYTFTVEAPNMRRYVRALTLVTSQALQLDITLEVGETANTITVDAATPLVQSATSDVNHLVEQAFIQNMPLESGRSGALVRLLPGVTFQQEETFEPQLDFSLAGGQSRSGEYRLDGGNITLNALLTRTIEFNPPIEATQEMKVEVNAYPAEYGHSTGGVFSMTSKSGSTRISATTTWMQGASLRPPSRLGDITCSALKRMDPFARTRLSSCSRTKAREEWTETQESTVSPRRRRFAAISPTSRPHCSTR